MMLRGIESKKKSCPESMSDARGAKEEEERFPSRPLSRSLPSSLAFSLQLKLEQDARTLFSWRCFERRGPERENEKVFRVLFFLFIWAAAREEERGQGRPTSEGEQGPTCKEQEGRSECAPLLSCPLLLGLDTAALVPGTRLLASCHCRWMKRRLNGAGKERAFSP